MGPDCRWRPNVITSRDGRVTSLRLVADVAVRADGTLWADLWLRNDIAMQPGGGEEALAGLAQKIADDEDRAHERPAFGQPEQQHHAHAPFGGRVPDKVGHARGLLELTHHREVVSREPEARAPQVCRVAQAEAALEGEHQQREQALLVVERMQARPDGGPDVHGEAWHPARVRAALVEEARHVLGLQAAQQAAAHLPRQPLGHLQRRQVAELDGHLAEAHLLVLHEIVRGLLEHLHVLRAGERAGGGLGGDPVDHVRAAEVGRYRDAFFGDEQAHDEPPFASGSAERPGDGHRDDGALEVQQVGATRDPPGM